MVLRLVVECFCSRGLMDNPGHGEVCCDTTCPQNDFLLDIYQYGCRITFTTTGYCRTTGTTLVLPHPWRDIRDAHRELCETVETEGDEDEQDL